MSNPEHRPPIEPGTDGKKTPTRYFVPADLSEIAKAIGGDSSGCYLEFDENNHFVRAISERQIDMEKMEGQMRKNPLLQAICSSVPETDVFQACILERLAAIENDFFHEYSRFVAEVKEAYPMLFSDRAVTWQVIRLLCDRQILKLSVIGPGEADWISSDGWIPEIYVNFEDWNVRTTITWARARV